jgi:hypothetical protein
MIVRLCLSRGRVGLVACWRTYHESEQHSDRLRHRRHHCAVALVSLVVLEEKTKRDEQRTTTSSSHLSDAWRRHGEAHTHTKHNTQRNTSPPLCLQSWRGGGCRHARVLAAVAQACADCCHWWFPGVCVCAEFKKATFERHRPPTSSQHSNSMPALSFDAPCLSRCSRSTRKWATMCSTRWTTCSLRTGWLRTRTAN